MYFVYWGYISGGVHVSWMLRIQLCVEFMYLVYWGYTSVGVYVPCILRIYLCRSLCTLYIWSTYLWWSLCTLYIEDIPLAEFMYLVYWGYTPGRVYVPCILRMYLWWSLCTLYIYIWRMYLWWSLCTMYIEDIPLVEFMYLVYWGYTSGRVYVPCILRIYLW